MVFLLPDDFGLLDFLRNCGGNFGIFLVDFNFIILFEALHRLQALKVLLSFVYFFLGVVDDFFTEFDGNFVVLSAFEHLFLLLQDLKQFHGGLLTDVEGVLEVPVTLLDGRTDRFPNFLVHAHFDLFRVHDFTDFL